MKNEAQKMKKFGVKFEGKLDEKVFEELKETYVKKLE